MNRILCLLAITISTFTADAVVPERFEAALRSAETYARQKTMVTDSLRSELRQAAATDSMCLMFELAGIYGDALPDSAIACLRSAGKIAREMGNNDIRMRAVLKELSLLPLTGMAYEAFDEYNSIDFLSLDSLLIKDYFLSGILMYEHAGNINVSDARRREAVRGEQELLSRFADMMPPESDDAALAQGFAFKLEDKDTEAAAMFAELLPRYTHQPCFYNIMASFLIEYYSRNPEWKEREMHYLIETAINMIETGNIRPNIMLRLGERLLEQGEEDLARICFRVSSSQIMECNVSDREVLQRLIDVIDSGDRRKERSLTLWHTIAFISMTLLFCCMLLFVFLLYRKGGRHITEENVPEKCEYGMYRMLSLALMACEQTREFNVFADRKLTAGQTKDFYNTVNSGKYIQQMNERFFEAFDEAFLSIFPQFVNQINSLFVADKKIVAAEGGRLSPELRIAAFMRLGISDGNKLAQVLGLSLNTIYTYRNRLKSRAAERDKFETNLLQVVK